MIITLISFY